MRQPFNTNALAQAAALESLRHPHDLVRRVRAVVDERARVTAALTDTSWGFTASQANFILVRPDSDPADGSVGAHEQLLRLGVIVRDGAPLGMSGVPAGLDRDPGRERRIPLGAGPARRAGPPRQRTRTDTTMMIVMQEGATEDQVRHVIDRIEQVGAKAHPSRGEFVTVIGAIGDDRALVSSLHLEGEPGVEKVVPILKPYKLVSARVPRQRHRRRGRRARAIGGGAFGLIAGPCAVESREQTLAVGPRLQGGRRDAPPRRRVQAAHLARTPSRASASRASRSWPRRATRPGLPIVTEVMDARQLDDVARGTPT